MKILKLTLLLAMCLTCVVSQAQDTYWALAGNKVFNTGSHSITALSATQPGIDYPAYARTVFDNNGVVLFTAGTDGVYYETSNMSTGYGTKQVFALPFSCKTYGVIDYGSVATPHGSYLTYTTVDASAITNDVNTSPGPTFSYSVTTLRNNGSPTSYGAGVGKLNVDGSRYLYYLNQEPAASTSTLYRYTISSSGTIGSPATLSSSMPVGLGLIKVAADGNSLAYVDVNNNLETYNLATGTTTSYTGTTISLGSDAGIEEINVTVFSTERRWYVSTGSAFGYFVEGAATWHSISTTVGIHSSIAAGSDGNFYFADGALSAAGQLYSFTRATTAITVSGGVVSGATKITGATIGAGNPGGTAFSFGNIVSGENTNRFFANPPVPVPYINGVATSPTTAMTLYDCVQMSYGVAPVFTIGNIDPVWTNYSISIVPAGGNSPVYYSSAIQYASLPTSYASGITVVGATPLDLRNLCSLSGSYSGQCDYLSSHTGDYDVIVHYYSNDACNGYATTALSRIHVVHPSAITAIPITINGKSGSQSIYLCGSSKILNLTAAPNGPISSYSITLQKGSYNPTTRFFTNIGAAASVSNTAVSIPTIDLYSIGAPIYLNGYSGYVKAIVTANGPCGGTVSDSVIFDLEVNPQVTSPSFTLDGFGKVTTSPTIPPPTIWMCNYDTVLKMKPKATGIVTSYTVEIVKGIFDANNQFAPLPATTPAKTFAPIDSFNLVDSFKTYLRYGDSIANGGLRIILTANGPCSKIADTQVYNIKSAKELIDFVMIGPKGSPSPCGNGNTQPRHTSLIFPPLAQPVSTTRPPCVEGWLGARTVGVGEAIIIDTQNTTALDYSIRVDRVTTDSGKFIEEIVPLISSGKELPVSFRFNDWSTEDEYFKSEYATIKTNYTFRVIVYVATDVCGTISDTAYFKIMDGGASGNGLRTTGIGNVNSDEENLIVYPNPANDKVTFSWNGNQPGTTTRLIIMDAAGRELVRKDISVDTEAPSYTQDVNAFASGIYLYRVSSGGQTYTGKFTKQ